MEKNTLIIFQTDVKYQLALNFSWKKSTSQQEGGVGTGRDKLSTKHNDGKHHHGKQQSNSRRERKQEALQTAAKCQQILLENGAKEVILFGSLSGESPWHWQSDLDLAVIGINSVFLPVFPVP